MESYKPMPTQPTTLLRIRSCRASRVNGPGATGTTLGADNDGAAACLAVLADDTLRHGPIEVLLDH